MTRPRICPQPGPHNSGADCPLYDRRLAFIRDEQLRHAVLSERGRSRDLAALVWADLNRDRQRTASSVPPHLAALPLTPETEPFPVPIFSNQKGATNE